MIYQKTALQVYINILVIISTTKKGLVLLAFPMPRMIPSDLRITLIIITTTTTTTTTTIIIIIIIIIIITTTTKDELCFLHLNFFTVHFFLTSILNV